MHVLSIWFLILLCHHQRPVILDNFMSLVLVGIQIQISITSNTLSNSLINFNKQEIKEFSWNLLGEYEKFEFIYPSDSIYKYIYKYIDNIAYIHMHVYIHTRMFTIHVY